MIERLPTPWGLVRSGVAPDHPKIKTVAKVFEKIAADSNFRLFGNVELGKDISLTDLTSKYDAVIMATGSSVGKKLGIPGEELANSISAAIFVPWYNGHPDLADFDVDLSGKVAVVIGAGNVAIDCGRILALDPKELDPTDIADHALEVFRKSNTRKVLITGRRGAEFASFTAPELRDLPKLEHTDVFISEEQIALAQANIQAIGEVDKHIASNLEAMKLVAETPKRGHDRSLEFLFSFTPKEIIGADKVEGIIFSTPDGEVTISCDLVITAIGYEPAHIAGINFEGGKISNTDGRITGSNMYVVGWAKRGPSGVIGTNKGDAAGVIALLVSDLKAPKNDGDITDLLDAEHKIVDQPFWVRINSAEISAGEALGRPRVKAVSVPDLLRLGQS
jgi:ferredoxin/flavodoxin---NADP+ reductase